MSDHHDGALIVQLSQWGSMMGLDDAVQTLFSDEFDPDAASIGIAPVRKVLSFGETVGTLVKNGVLDRELVLDWLWVSGLWGRVGAAARAEREKHGVPELYENFEALARAQA